jgi:hypothetical protein
MLMNANNVMEQRRTGKAVVFERSVEESEVTVLPKENLQMTTQFIVPAEFR